MHIYNLFVLVTLTFDQLPPITMVTFRFNQPNYYGEPWDSSNPIILVNLEIQSTPPNYFGEPEIQSTPPNYFGEPEIQSTPPNYFGEPWDSINASQLFWWTWDSINASQLFWWTWDSINASQLFCWTSRFNQHFPVILGCKERVALCNQILLFSPFLTHG